MAKGERHASSVLLVTGLLLGFALSSFQVARGKRLKGKFEAAVDAYMREDHNGFAEARAEAVALGLDVRRVAALRAVWTDAGPCTDAEYGVLQDALRDRLDEAMRVIGLLGLAECHIRGEQPLQAVTLLNDWTAPPHSVPETTVVARLRAASAAINATKAREETEKRARAQAAAEQRAAESALREELRRADLERSLESAMGALQTEFGKAIEEAQRGLLLAGDARLMLIDRLVARYEGEVRFRLDSAVQALRLAVAASAIVREMEGYLADANRYGAYREVPRWVARRDHAREDILRSIALAEEQLRTARELMLRSPVVGAPAPAVPVTQWGSQ